MAIWPFWPASDLTVALKNEVSTDSTLSLKNKKKSFSLAQTLFCRTHSLSLHEISCSSFLLDQNHKVKMSSSPL